jgi:hypothetical protein
MMVLALSFVLGMVVALAVYFAWRQNVGDLRSSGALTAIALVVCPPYVLTLALGPTSDSGLALVLIVGTNAFLYAGVAAGGFFIYTLATKKRVPR